MRAIRLLADFRVGLGFASSFSLCAGFWLTLTSPVYGQGGFSGPGRYEITNIKSGKVIDLDRNDQTTVIQFASRGTDNQSWDVIPGDGGTFVFRNGMNGNALTAPLGGNGPLQGAPYRGDESQQWRIEAGKDGNAIILSRSGRALDIPDGTDRDGVRIRLYDRNGDSNQRFMFRPMGSGPGGGPQSGGYYRRGVNEGPYQGNNGYPNRSGNREDLGQRAYGYERPPAAVVTCSSNDGGRKHCSADTRNGVQMSRQISGSPCIEGQTWGYDPARIWVDRGCRAEFTLGAGYPANYRPGGAGGTVSICESNDGGRRMCGADTSQGVQMIRQISGSPCIEGQTWGYTSRGIWVDRGCRAEFSTGRRDNRYRR